MQCAYIIRFKNYFETLIIKRNRRKKKTEIKQEEEENINAILQYYNQS